jgi:thioredoxin-like negative regulator of GroEL
VRIPLLLLAMLTPSVAGDTKTLLDTKAMLVEARALLDAGKYDEALRAFKKVDDTLKACATCALDMAQTHLRRGATRDAVIHSERALRLGLPNAQEQALAHLVKGRALTLGAAAGQPDGLLEAEEALRKALELSSNDTIRFNLGVLLLRLKRDEEGVEMLEAFLRADPSSPRAKEARDFLQNPRRARERWAPDVELQTLDGERLALASLRGKIVVLDFWTTRCRPCLASVPDLRDLVRRHPRDELALVSISVDEDEEKWRTFVAREGMTWPQVRDSGYRLSMAFGVSSFPTYVLIDQEGFVKHQIEGRNPRLLQTLLPQRGQ